MVFSRKLHKGQCKTKKHQEQLQYKTGKCLHDTRYIEKNGFFPTKILTFSCKLRKVRIFYAKRNEFLWFKKFTESNELETDRKNTDKLL
jgi:hypothetical protein